MSLGVELLGYMEVLLLVFWEISIPFSTVASSIYSPTNSVWRFPFLHILANIYYLCLFWWQPFWQVWGDISLWFWFAFPWWLVMLTTFSYSCWPSSFPFWKKIFVPFFCPCLNWTFYKICISCLYIQLAKTFVF